LTEGPSIPRKILPKAIEHVLVEFNDGACVVKYYNKDLRKILTSRNYKSIKSDPRRPLEDDNHSPMDQIRDTNSHPGPSTEVNAPAPSTPTDGTACSNKRSSNDLDLPHPKRTRGVKRDYKQLDNPFSDTDDDEDSLIVVHLMINDESYNAATNDGPISLKEAKQSPNWPEWEKAIEIELETLRDMNTWRLVAKPLDVIPITNKWLFVKKTNNLGQISKYKARLVIKGCSQRPGFDYSETYSPVIHMETIRSILAIVPQMDLHIQQMDIKGAYLNGILKEDVYMRQPEGYSDGSDKVCKLVKTLYGLKQAGCEWNIQFNQGLQDMGFT
jgi:hypothetical protein